jgi:aldose 1-epimerase
MGVAPGIPTGCRGATAANRSQQQPRVEATMISAQPFGDTTEGIRVDRYTLRNDHGLIVRLITWGATVTELHLPDRRGQLADVVLGFDRLPPYETESPYFGATIGRVAFRTARGRFVLDGTPHQLTLNDGPHHLHGGSVGFSSVVWQAEPLETEDGPAVKFQYHSPDGDQGYPGNFDASATYTLTHQNELRIDFTAAADRPTPVNMTHHSYFNLAGHASGDVLDHVLQIDADRYSVTDEATIATGDLADVAETPFDFIRPTVIGKRLGEIPGEPGGYDLAYLHNHAEGSLARVATVTEPVSGRTMDVLTTEPAIIFYTGNYLDGSLRGKAGATYRKQAGLCLEPGRLPDALNLPSFPSVIVRPPANYRHTCVYRFSAE